MSHRLFDTDLHITSGYKTRSRPDHIGVDLRVRQGSKLYACEQSIVKRVLKDKWGARIIDLRVGNTVYRYGHILQSTVKVGQQLIEGQFIGLSGGQPGTDGAGNSTGPHLHFEIMDLNFKRIDPTFYINQIFSQPQKQINMSNKYIVKKGGWVSQVITEIIQAGIWPGNWQDHQAHFTRLNPVTPKGGYKPGNIVLIADEPAPLPVPQPIPQPIPEVNTVDWEGIHNQLKSDYTSLEIKYEAKIKELEGLNEELVLAQEQYSRMAELANNQSREIDRLQTQLAKQAVENVQNKKDKWSWNKWFVGLSKFGLTDAFMVQGLGILVGYLSNLDIDTTTLAGALLASIITILKSNYQLQKNKNV